MDPPYEQTPVRGKVIELPKVTPASIAAKFSIIAAVTVIGLNLAEITVLQGRSAALTVAGVAALIAVWAGVIAAVAGLAGAWKSTAKGVMPLALAGLLLNGSLLAAGFVKTPPIRGKLHAAQKNLSANELEPRPLSSKSRRTIVTKDWTAAYAIELTDAAFDDVVNDSDVPVLVDFWAPWCGPCRMMSPVIEEVAQDYAEKIKVCKLNVDNARDTASKFRITAIPTIILFNNGRVQKKWVGLTSKQEISAQIQKLL